MAATTTFATVFGKIQTGLGDTTSDTLGKIKLAINQAYRRLGTAVYGITISTDLVGDSDVIALEDGWIYVLVTGALGEYYSLWDDSRAAEKNKVFEDLIALMIKEYGTRNGTFGTFQQLYTDIAGDMGLWSKSGVAKIKAAINDAYSEILSYDEWSFNKVADAVVVGDGGTEYTLLGKKQSNIRVGSDLNVAGLEKKDIAWVNYSLEMNSSINTAISYNRPTHWADMGGGGIKINRSIPVGILIYYDYTKELVTLTADSDTLVIPKDYIHVLKTVAVSYITGTIKDMQAADKAKKAMRMEVFKNEDNDVTMLRGRNNVK